MLLPFSHTTGARKLRKFLFRRGAPIKCIPKVNGSFLDIYKLFKSVCARQGYDTCVQGGCWGDIALDVLNIQVGPVRALACD